MIKNILAIMFVSMMGFSMSQEISGHVLDQISEEPIPFAKLYIIELEMGVICDSSGGFTINTTLPSQFKVKVSAPLYEAIVFDVKIEDQHFDFYLGKEHVELQDVVVSSPLGLKNAENAFKVDRLELNTTEGVLSISLPEALSNIPGVQQASFGTGISKPVIRGMQGVRLITMLNGVRLENQQWGGDHGMGINQLGVGSAEVIKGPSSLLYGPDAFGGVLYLVDEPYSLHNSVEVKLSSQYSSVSNGLMSSAGVKVSKDKLRFNIYGLYNTQADYAVGPNQYAFNTRFKEQGIKGALSYRNKNWVINGRYTFSENFSGLPGHAHHEEEIIEETEEEHDELYEDHQERDQITPSIYSLNQIVSVENKFFFNRSQLDIILANTNNSIKEFEESLDTAALILNLNNSLYNAKWKYNINEHWTLAIGAQGMYQLSENDESAEEILIPDYNQLDNGIYSVFGYSKNKLSIQFGGRYDNRLLQTASNNYSFNSGNFSAGIVKQLKQVDLRLNVSSGYRVPHVSELFANGEHEGALRYEIGNDQLNPEKSIQFDAGIEIHKEHIEVVINPYYNFLRDYIYLQRIDSVFDGLPVFEYQQYGQSNMYGIDLGLHYHPHFAHWLHIESSYSYVRGEDLNGNSFSLMPQPKWNSTIKFAFESKYKFKVENIAIQNEYFFAQNYVTDMEMTSPAYNLVHVGLNMKVDIAQPIYIGVGVKNLLNENYINHLSRLKNIGMWQPGRNFYVSIKWNFLNSLK